MKPTKIKITIALFLFLIPLFSLFPIDTFDSNDSYQKVDKYQAFSDKLPQMVAADNKAIVYSGKVDFTQSDAPRFSHAGCTVKALFEGSGIDLVIEDNGFKDYCLVFIDKKKPILLPLKRGKRSYTIARDLGEGTHSIEIFKRTEANCGMITFWGFGLQEGKGLVPIPPENKKKMFFIGDSITAGYGNDRHKEGDPEVGFDPFYQNHYNAYGAIASRNLGSEYQTVCYSGIGLIKGSNGDVRYNMPGLFRQFYHGSKGEWDPADYVPDVIVLNLGTNDYASENLGIELDDNHFMDRYNAFLDELRGYWPEAHIICVVGCMITDDWPEGRQAKTRATECITTVTDTLRRGGDTKIHFLELNVSQKPNGDDHHPNTPNHIEMAKIVEIFCRNTLGWK